MEEVSGTVLVGESFDPVRGRVVVDEGRIGAVEETETGYRLTVKSTRGTGTRDQDKVSLVAKTESLPDPATVTEVCDRVRNAMNQRRAHEPDSGGEG